MKKKIELQKLINTPAYKPKYFTLPTFLVDIRKRIEYPYISIIFVVAFYSFGFRVYKVK
jgi:hypothetical protein